MAKADPSGQYQPEAFAGAPDDSSLIIAWMTRELQKVSSAFELGVSRSVEVLNVAPAKPREGMFASADGVNWNPGSGAGPYMYIGGIWVFLGAQQQDNTKPGVIVDYGGTAVPSGFLLCDGSNVSRTTYAALFATIGTTWGVGNGSTTFGLPDSRRRTSVGSGGTATATLGNAVGNIGGEEAHVLTAAENGSHQHNIGYANPGSGGSTLPSVTTTGGAPISNVLTDASGSGTAHNTIQPSMVVTKMIKT